ncbi:hypothetical protein [Pseudoalteromonas sp. XMcav11-Q]|uniref:hypothetical protein n=1 Tax=Pseudoalteromonas sp. XMcav11-Q TaxID=3136665 RepID=UPI0032C3E5F7
MNKLLIKLTINLSFVFSIASSWAADPLTELKNEINKSINSKNSRFLKYGNTNKKSEFPRVPNQFICTFPDGSQIYNIIKKNNEIIENITDKSVQLAMVQELRAFEEKIMNISAWDLFLSVNSNINSKDSAFPGSVSFTSDYIPRWGTWLHDTTSSPKLVDANTFEMNAKSVSDGNWKCQGDCLKNTLDLELFSKEQRVDGGGILIDQAGNPIYYESRANGLLYQDLAEGFQYSVPMSFPLGQCTEYIDIGLEVGGEAGKRQNILPVVSVKLGWKILTKQDDPNKYFSMENITLNQNGKTVQSKLGLVAMHVAIKEQRQYQWRWVTFEHIDNLNEPEQHSSETPTFNNPNCHDCCDNLLPKKSDSPAQLTRLEPLSTNTILLNNKMRSLLKSNNSVFQHYKLVRTQYTSLVTPNLKQFFIERTPSDARNAVLEPFVLPEITNCSNKEKYIVPIHTFKTGCMGCHKYAEYKTKNGKSETADFTFISPLNIQKENTNE